MHSRLLCISTTGRNEIVSVHLSLSKESAVQETHTENKKIYISGLEFEPCPSDK